VSTAGWCTVAGVGLDLAAGDPRWMPHPVRAIGWAIARQEKFWRSVGVPLRMAGVLLWLVTVGGAAAIVYATLRVIPPPYAAIYWIYSLVAIRDLDNHANRVVIALRKHDLPAAREKLSWIVGRDTVGLDERDVLRGAVETVAENLGDGIVAPLFYLAICGPAAMAAYKAVNTLDSMVGHRNERYRELGWFAARADDWANGIPARLTAVLIWLVSLLPGFSLARSVRVTLRDGASQPSPNSGYPEAAVAGALGVQLGGLNYYSGVASRKAFLGDPVNALDTGVYPRVRILLYGVALLAAALAAMGARW
jgi:adenosylcobinamide-phosphate synthase